MSETIASQPGSRDPERGDPALEVRVETSLDAVDRDAWDALEHGPSPFLRWGFLRALEASGSIGKGSGWHPFYILAETRPDAERGGAAGEPHRLVGAVAAFVKSHSYGEYIFDWSWAGASERAGVPYYPKMVVAAPVTPATGRRILLAPGADPEQMTAVLAAVVKSIADEVGCSSVHWLFCTADEQERLVRLGFAARASYQFHWHNDDYTDFDDFLSRLTSRKRKQLRKERRRARAGIDAIDFVRGGELDKGALDCLDRYYRSTVWAHGGMDYLRPGFFHRLAELMPEEMVFAQARAGGDTVAGALYLETAHGLYGRYWGCDEERDLLHFEVAYYAGIERCIERGIPLFEAGAQGEHKLLRGFVPSPTYSAHWLRHPGLDEAIRAYLADEAQSIEHRMAMLAEHGPYKRGE